MITSLSVGGLMIAGAAVAGDDGGGAIAISYNRSAARAFQVAGNAHRNSVLQA
jgi:hypothetical protein